MVKMLNAIGADCMTTMHKYTRDSFTHVKLATAELAYIKATRLVIEVHNLCVAHFDLMKSLEKVVKLIINYPYFIRVLYLNLNNCDFIE